MIKCGHCKKKRNTTTPQFLPLKYGKNPFAYLCEDCFDRIWTKGHIYQGIVKEAYI